MNRQLQSSSSSSGKPCYMVWGASIGWLALYAGLTHSSWRVVGVELLPLLVLVAQHTAEVAGLKGEHWNVSTSRSLYVTSVPAASLNFSATCCTLFYNSLKQQHAMWLLTQSTVTTRWLPHTFSWSLHACCLRLLQVFPFSAATCLPATSAVWACCC
jgi:hypothetical protein